MEETSHTEHWRGPRGRPGPKGDKGDKGDPGPKGDGGNRGPKGDQGAKGDGGPKGDKGDPGDQGLRGRRGKAGEPGGIGPPGLLGRSGNAGYVYADDPDEGQYVPTTQWNSAGDANRILRAKEGVYEVTFPNLADGAPLGVALVTTVDFRGVLASVKDHRVQGSDVIVDVECFGTRGGAAADREFMLMYVS